LHALSRRQPPPEQVVIEASGIADPVKVGYFASMPPYRLDGVVVLVDAETILARAADKYVGGAVLRQLRGADLIVLNKIDLVDIEQQAACNAWLRGEVPEARVIAASHGRVPLALLLGLRAGEMPSEQDEHAHVHDHGAQYVSASVAFDRPMAGAELRAAIAAWPPAVLRAKGIVQLAEDPLRRYVLQLVGRRWSLTPDRLWGEDTPRSEFVVIGLAGELDGAALLEALARPRATA
jgi:G3E family GTPase